MSGPQSATTVSFPAAQLIPKAVAAMGALDFDVREQGISPRRLPSWTRPQLPDLMHTLVRMPSGVRLRFMSDAKTLGIGFLGTNMVTPPAERRDLVMNLEFNGERRVAKSTAGNCIVLDPDRSGKFEMQRGAADCLWFHELPGVSCLFELWLPHNAFVELRSIHINQGAQIHAAPADVRATWVHYGSSISHCMEAEEPALVWPAVAARAADVCLQSLGFGGQCHLDPFVARTIRDSDADLISAKIGINLVNMDSMRERIFGPALHGFLDTIREAKPSTPIMLISPIFCPSAETQPGPTLLGDDGKFMTVSGSRHLRQGALTLQYIREFMRQLVSDRTAAGDANLHYLDGLTLFGAEDEADLPDALHPNPQGYVRMGERFAPHLRQLMEQV